MRWLALTPLGAPPAEVLQDIGGAVVRTFGCEVRTTATIAEPQHAFDARRGQWASAEMLKTLLAQSPAEAAWVLGITERDLYVPVLSFVFGQAQLRGRAAVVSLARLRPESYGMPPDAELLAERAVKEALHELGHVFGLVHCLDRSCPMSLSVGLNEIDAKTAEPCPSCSALLEGSLEMPRPRTTTPPPNGDRR